MSYRAKTGFTSGVISKRVRRSFSEEASRDTKTLGEVEATFSKKPLFSHSIHPTAVSRTIKVPVFFCAMLILRTMMDI